MAQFGLLFLPLVDWHDICVTVGAAESITLNGLELLGLQSQLSYLVTTQIALSLSISEMVQEHLFAFEQYFLIVNVIFTVYEEAVSDFSFTLVHA